MRWIIVKGGGGRVQDKGMQLILLILEFTYMYIVSYRMLLGNKCYTSLLPTHMVSEFIKAPLVGTNKYYTLNEWVWFRLKRVVVN